MEDNRAYILIYGFCGPRFSAIKEIAAGKDIGLKLLKDEDLKTVVQDLLLKKNEELPEIQGEDLPAESELEFMLFVNFSRDHLFSFLEDLKAKELYIPYKAGLTETNINWQLSDLITANKREHQFMMLYQRSKGILQVGANLYQSKRDPLLLDNLEKLQQYLTEIEATQAESEEEELAIFENLLAHYNELAARIKQLKES